MVRSGLGALVAVLGCVLVIAAAPPQGKPVPVDVPVTLDHNRMLVDAEFLRQDGSWRKARLWIDSGAPDFFMSETLARDLGIDLGATEEAPASGRIEIEPPSGVRIGGMPLNFAGVKASVLLRPAWIFSTMPIEANLPATVLMQYQVVFDYPKSRLTLADPGSVALRGRRVPAAVNRATGIVQIDAVIAGDSISLALDNGASYSFISTDVLARMLETHPHWPRINGAVGCANIWGWWPQETDWTVARLPEVRCGSVKLVGVGLAGIPGFFEPGSSLGEWYSKKTVRPVQGFLGPNAFKAFRVTIDYANSAVYFDKGARADIHDMDLVGLTLRPQSDGSYQVIGVARQDGRSAVPGVEPGDTLLRVGRLEVTGSSMGTVVDALRGEPGDTRTLIVEREGAQIEVHARIERFL